MMPCERVCALAPGLAALAADDPERLAAEAHAAECPSCARALQEAVKLQSLLGEIPYEPLPPGALERASARIREELVCEGRRRMASAALAAAAAAIVLVAFARHHSPAPLDRAVAAGLFLVAVVLAGAASRRPVAALAVAIGASLTATAITGSPGPVVGGLGVECLAVEVGSAALVVGAAWLALRGGTTSPPRIAAAGTAAAGALAGAAALQLTCPAHASAPHLLVFHVGGVLVATAAARLLWHPPGEARPAWR